MNTLQEDLQEVAGAAAQRWVRAQRRRWGIGPDEPATWFAVVESGRPYYESNTATLGRSPGDVLLTAELIVDGRYGGGYRRLGLGSWILEVYGEEGVDPDYLRVMPVYDPEGATT